jgi:hypothetical protein
MRSPHPHALSGNIPARRLKVKFSLFCANQFTGAHGGEGHEFQRQPSDARPLINLPGCCWTSSGGAGSLEQTALSVHFPANREFSREFLGFSALVHAWRRMTCCTIHGA